MSAITISSFQFQTAQQFPGGTVKLRIYYTGAPANNFIASEGVIVQCGNLATNQGFYVSVSATIATGIVTVPSFVLESTDDSNQPAVTATGILFDQNGARRNTLFSNWVITATLGTPVTFQQLYTFNQGNVIPNPPATYLTAAQVAALISQTAGLLNKANASIFGVTRLSLDPAVPATPIAVGDNDPRVVPNNNVVLRWSGSFPQSLDFGLFWPDNTLDLGKFFWEFWCKPDPGAQYLISDGYGGAHAILFGFQAAMSGVDAMSGNVWNGASSTSFTSDTGPQVGEWALVAASYDGTWLTIYYNGVPVGSTAFSGPRKTFGGGGGGGSLFIGGSDHQNFKGVMGQVRGWEGTNPLTPFNDGFFVIPKPYRPETFFSGYGVVTPINTPRATLVASMLRPEPLIPNLVGNEMGRLRNFSGGITAGLNDQFPLQQYEFDVTAPSFSTLVAPTPPVVTLPSPPSTPVGARVFDSFTRQNRTLAFSGVGGLGSTEAGSAGVKTWNQDTPFSGTFGEGGFGILNGMAVDLFGVPEIAWVTGVGTADMTVSADRNPNANTGINTGVAFRVQDQNNFLYAYTAGTSGASTILHVGAVVASVQTDSGATAAMPSSWTTLKAVCSGTTITVFADATLVATRTITNFATQQGAGLWNQFALGGLPSKWDNFTVL